MLIDSLHDQEPHEELYHYTSHAGLIGIVRDRELWASKAIFMNDAQEFKLALDVTRAEVGKRSLNSALSDELLEDIEDIKHANVFVASFSEEPDLLSQWRGYCSPGPGYSVGFKGSDLATRSPFRFFLAKCSYDPSDHDTIAAELVDHGLARLKGLPNAQPLGAAADPRWSLPFRDLLAFTAPLLKHPSFREEREWRLVSYPLSYTDPQFSHRAGRSTLVPFYRLPLGNADGVAPVARVVIGPTPHPELAEDAVFSLLGAARVQGCAIDHSEIPFRNW